MLLQMIKREQDDQFEEGGQTIGVLKAMGTQIGEELDDQNVYEFSRTRRALRNSGCGVFL